MIDGEDLPRHLLDVEAKVIVKHRRKVVVTISDGCIHPDVGERVIKTVGIACPHESVKIVPRPERRGEQKLRAFRLQHPVHEHLNRIAVGEAIGQRERKGLRRADRIRQRQSQLFHDAAGAINPVHIHAAFRTLTKVDLAVQGALGLEYVARQMHPRDDGCLFPGGFWRLSCKPARVSKPTGAQRTCSAGSAQKSPSTRVSHKPPLPSVASCGQYQPFRNKPVGVV